MGIVINGRCGLGSIASSSGMELIMLPHVMAYAWPVCMISSHLGAINASKVSIKIVLT